MTNNESDGIISQSPKSEPEQTDDRNQDYRSPSPTVSDQPGVNGTSTNLSPGGYNIEVWQQSDGPWSRITPRSSFANLAEANVSSGQVDNGGAAPSVDGDSTSDSEEHGDDDDDGDEDDDVDDDDDGEYPTGGPVRGPRRSSRRAA
jgi:hypothetical protein